MFDLVIKNGLVFDSGWEKAEVLNIGISEGIIASLTTEKISGYTELNAKGLLTVPGFIDIHSHSDLNFKKSSTKYETGEMALKMGVTTIVGGNCGYSPYNLNIFLRSMAYRGIPNNYLGFYGHLALREVVGITDPYKEVNRKELNRMKEVLTKAMDYGALGFSVGFEYTPGATFEEIVELAGVLIDYPGSLVSAHYRYDADKGIEAIEELIQITEASGVPMQISHLNSGICFGNADLGLEVIDDAINRGLDIMADAYPYHAFSTFIGSPLFDPDCIKRWKVGFEDLVIAEGKYVGEFCNEELFSKLRIEEPEIYVNAFVMKEAEVIEVVKSPFVMIASDGLIKNGFGHPRAAGTFPRVLSKYVKEGGFMSFNEAIDQMTTLPAKRVGLTDRGIIEENAIADLVVMDYNAVTDNADFTNPTESPGGINHVIVNGQPALYNKRVINKRAGKVLDAGIRRRAELERVYL